MRALVTGGAGFIGRWVVKELLDGDHEVTVLDNFSSGRRENLAEFLDAPGFAVLVDGDIRNRDTLSGIFPGQDVCYHLAASINVQDSIDEPVEAFDNDVVGTFNVLEECRRNNTKMVFVSTCMVYAPAADGSAINENHPVNPASPYAAAKLAGEALVLSYYHTYELPVVILRPFNTYGPFQKTNGEGGVVAIFASRSLAGDNLVIYGDGTQTRDLLYVEDCARFVVAAGRNEAANGLILNAGSNADISISQLAISIVEDISRIQHVPHIHPQSEIHKLLCNYSKAESVLGWRPIVGLNEGIQKTTQWIRVQ